MSKWTRHEVPEGMVKHHARGWGECCRAAYNRHREQERQHTPAPVTRKPVDRRRHHPETALARLRTRARVEGWSEEEFAAEVEREKQREKQRRREVARRRREVARADAARHGWDMTTREVAELVGITDGVVNECARQGLLSRTNWEGVRGYLYRLEEVVEVWPNA